MTGRLESRMVEAVERIAAAAERNAAGIERLADEAERAEVRRAAKGLLKLQADYPQETERRPLRLVRK